MTKATLWKTLGILDSRNRRTFTLACSAQVVLALFDAIGVLLVGIMVAIATSPSGKTSVVYVNRILDAFGLEKYDYQYQLIYVGSGAFLFLLVKTLLSLWLIRTVTIFLSRQGALLSQSLVSKLLSKSLTQIEEMSLQESLFALTTGVKSLTVGVLTKSYVFFSDIITLLIIALGLLAVDLRIAGLSFSIFGGLGLVLYLAMRRRVVILGALQSEIAVKSNQEIYEVLGSFRENFVKNRRNFYARRIGQRRLSLADVDAKYAFLNVTSKYIFDSSVIFGTILVAGIQFRFVGGEEAIASLGLFLAAATRVAPAVLRLQQNAVDIKGGLNSSNLTFQLIAKLEDTNEVQADSDLFDSTYENFEGAVKVQNVSFQYPGSEKFALRNVTLEFEATKYYAIVGGSGAGKSTLVDLMLGIMTPNIGKISISDKTPLDAIRDWQGAIAYVPQDIVIISGSIRENVSMGFPIESATDERVMRAIEVAQLSDLVETLPEGLDTFVGDRGSKLSGGQRQRLGIARALFTNPKLLILDEATSSLDAKTEAEFSDSINQLKGEVTLIVIAHRLSTVRYADSVVFLQNGEVISVGTFDVVRRSVAEFDLQANLMGL
jgi:ABC-type multidrug transport system fused ATPase/permease subunit